jgi:hypothetical protein
MFFFKKNLELRDPIGTRSKHPYELKTTMSSIETSNHYAYNKILNITHPKG